MIEVKNLTKKYGSYEAVKGVSFSVGGGQVLGFLGPNGAGKTTIMKILTGFHFPTSGEAMIDGFSVLENPEECKRRIGYLPENVPLYGDLSIREYLGFIAEARGIAKTETAAAVTRAIESCGLGPMGGKKIEALSKGYRQRVGLAQAIIHDPPILILDEPTTGLDPNQIIEIRSLITDLGKSKTVILSTHIMQEVEAVCSQVLIINEGKIAAQGNPAEIAASLKGASLGAWELDFYGADVAAVEKAFAEFSAPGLTAGGFTAKAGDDGVVSAEFFLTPATGDEPPTKAAAGAEVFDWAVAHGLRLAKMAEKTRSLEDIFVELTTEETHGK
jgi:ABC-2 type transport system ATP-binding protein